MSDAAVEYQCAVCSSIQEFFVLSLLEYCFRNGSWANNTEISLCIFMVQSCGIKVKLSSQDPVRCNTCGGRILWKLRTKKIVQYEARAVETDTLEMFRPCADAYAT